MCILPFFVCMTPGLILTVIIIYFVVLMGIAWLTSRGADNDSFFVGNRKSPWFVVAFGMIGASLSGVTFISVPGSVQGASFGYMQMVLGFLVGYFVIAFVLMPLYYRLQLTSIYTYLRDRLGMYSYRTGAAYFLLSRILGASFRLFLVANVLQEFVFKPMGVPFFVTVSLSILFIWIYTFRGGIKTIIWTDTLQTLFMLVSVGASIYLISSKLEWDFSELTYQIASSDMSRMFFFDDISAGSHFLKQFLGGMFIAICMTGLDQDMMQKNLSCKSLKDAKKNMISFAVVLVFVNLVFLVLGAMLFMYANQTGMDLPYDEITGKLKGDLVYPEIALNGGLGVGVGVIFLLGLIAAAYSSADSALTSLTTSVCVDFIDIEKKPKKDQIVIRKITHVIMSFVLLICILIFHAVADESVIWLLFKAAGYTYGPLLGLFAFGILTNYKVRDNYVPYACLLSPIIIYILNMYSADLFGGFELGFILLPLNGALTFLFLFLLKDGRAEFSFSDQLDGSKKLI